MSNKQKNDKYIDLVEKLMNYMIHNGNITKKLPKDASFIAFSKNSKELYEYAEKILESVKKAHEGKPIVKAEEQDAKTNTWKFTTITRS